MSTFTDVILQKITPEIEEMYLRFILGKSCIIFGEDNIWHFYALGLWWTVSHKKILKTKFFTCKAWDFFTATEIKLNIDLILTKVKQCYKVIISNKNRYINIVISNDNFWYYLKINDGSDEKYTHLTVHGSFNSLVQDLIDVLKIDNVNFYFEKHFDCHDKTIKSNLIKRYYKNALVNHNTKFGMNKMFDSFVF